MKLATFEKHCKRMQLVLDDDGTASWPRIGKVEFVVICAYNFGGGQIYLRPINGEDIEMSDKEFATSSRHSLSKLARESTMHRYDEEKGDNQKWVNLTKIVVPTQADKDQILLALEYMHDLREIDTDILAVNLLAHLYLRPDLIEVEDERKSCEYIEKHV